MQKPDFEIVVESNPNYSMAPLYQGAAFAVAMQGAKYIRFVHDSGDTLVCYDTHVQGWHERPEGWLTEMQRQINSADAAAERKMAEKFAEDRRGFLERMEKLRAEKFGIFSKINPWRAVGAVLVALTLSFPAWAGMDARVTASTITVTSGNCLAQRNERQSLSLDASGASANIGYCYGAACTAAIGTVGTVNMGYGAGALHFWPAGSAPRGGFCFIAGSGSQPLTIIEGLQ